MYKHFVKKFGLKEDLYPEDSSKRTAIHHVLDDWKVEESVSTYLRHQLYDRLRNPNATHIPGVEAPVSTVLAKADAVLAQSKFVAGDHVTIADYYVFGDLLLLKQIKFDFGKFPHILKWMKDLEKSESATSVQTDIENILATTHSFPK
jgi:glutathione S-transferase